MAVAGAIRSSPAVGLWHTAWRAGERTQWQQVRAASSVDRVTQARNKKQMLRKAKEPNEAMGGAEQTYQLFMPTTWVRPPLSRFPPSPKYLYAYLKIKVRDCLGRLALRFSSKPSVFKAALYKPQTSKIVPMAKTLHVTMYEALAKGDKATLRKVCGIVLADRFGAAIDARPRGRRYGWELLRYNKTIWGYPRIMDHKLMPMQADPREPKKQTPPIVRQAVVSIATRQRRVEFDYSKEGGGRVIPGSEKEVDVVENLVLNQVLDRNTWVPMTDWKIISLIGEMTPEKWEEEEEKMRRLDRLQAQAAASKIGIKG